MAKKKKAALNKKDLSSDSEPSLLAPEDNSGFKTSPTPSSPPISEGDSKMETSPYASPVLQLTFKGGESLQIHREVFCKNPELESLTSNGLFFGTTSIGLDDVQLDAGHVLIHYLLTEKYESLKPLGDTPTERASSEISTALRVCSIAESYQLPLLGDLAQAEILRLGSELSLVRILDLVEKTTPNPIDTPWISRYLESRMQALYKDLTHSLADELLAELETATAVSKLVLRSVVKLRSGDLLREAAQCQDSESTTENFESKGNATRDEPTVEVPDSLADSLLVVDEDSPVVVEDEHRSIDGGFIFPKLDAEVNDADYTLAQPIVGLGDQYAFARAHSVKAKLNKKGLKKKNKKKKELGDQFSWGSPEDSKEDEPLSTSFKLIPKNWGETQDKDTRSVPVICENQLGHLSVGGGWKTCTICRRLVLQFFTEL